MIIPAVEHYLSKKPLNKNWSTPYIPKSWGTLKAGGHPPDFRQSVLWTPFLGYSCLMYK
jgi:hypothetical protein